MAIQDLFKLISRIFLLLVLRMRRDEA